MVGDVELIMLLSTGSGFQLFAHLELVLKNVLVGVVDVVDVVAVLRFGFCLGAALAMVVVLLICCYC